MKFEKLIQTVGFICLTSLVSLFGISLFGANSVRAAAVGCYSVDDSSFCGLTPCSGRCGEGFPNGRGGVDFIFAGSIYKCVDEFKPDNEAYFEMDARGSVSTLKIIAHGPPGLGDHDAQGRNRVTVACENGHCQSQNDFYVRGYFTRGDKTEAIFMLGRSFEYGGLCKKLK